MVAESQVFPVQGTLAVGASHQMVRLLQGRSTTTTCYCIKVPGSKRTIIAIAMADFALSTYGLPVKRDRRYTKVRSCHVAWAIFLSLELDEKSDGHFIVQ